MLRRTLSGAACCGRGIPAAAGVMEGGKSDEVTDTVTVATAAATNAVTAAVSGSQTQQAKCNRPPGPLDHLN
jgi:hypothetical protein